MAYKSTKRKTGDNSTETKTYSTKGGTRYTRTTKINGVTRSVSWSSKNPSKTKRTRTQRSGEYIDRRSNTSGPSNRSSSEDSSGSPFGLFLLIPALFLGFICFLFPVTIPYIVVGVLVLGILWWVIGIIFAMIPWLLLLAFVSLVAYILIKIAAFF